MNGATESELDLIRTLKRFVEWARQRGWRYQSAPGHLQHFQRFLEHRGVEHLTDVSAALLGEYQHSLSMQKSPATVCGYSSTLRALWRYLLKAELVTDDATRGLRALRQDYFVPHLYAAHELRSIERATRAAIEQAKGSRQRFARRTQYAAFGLLRDCGLRVSEACRLNVHDFDPRERTLRIELTKFFKTRTIPLPRSTAARLTQYLGHRQALVGALAEVESPALFLSACGHRLVRVALETPFKQLASELGLYRSRRRQGRTVFGSTNLHALRHSFAVRSLERWQVEKSDVERLLPLLSAYMGHAHVSYTKHYLHLTATLRKLASERFAELALPELDPVPRARRR